MDRERKQDLLFEALENQESVHRQVVNDLMDDINYQRGQTERAEERYKKLADVITGGKYALPSDIILIAQTLIEFEKNHSVNEINLTYFQGFAEGIAAAKKEIIKKVPKYTGNWIPQRKYYLRILSNLINETVKKANDARR